MLVISRRTEEEVLIDNGRIKVKILGVSGKVVKLGFEAHRSVPIERGESIDPDGRKRDTDGQY